MPKKRDTPELARRERQIMDVIFQLGEATVGDVLERLPDPPSYSSVRTIIRKIESKGLLTHRQDGKRYVYRAKQSRETASRTALQKLMDVFIGTPIRHDLSVKLGEVIKQELPVEGEISIAVPSSGHQPITVQYCRFVLFRRAIHFITLGRGLDLFHYH